MKKNDNLILQCTLLGVALGLVKNGLEQWSELQTVPQKKFNLEDFLFSGIVGGAIGGASAALFILLASLLDSDEIDEEDFQEVEYLQGVLSSYALDEVDQATLRKGFEIKNKIYEKFGNDLLGKPKFQGSMAQKTALSGISDLDIRIAFKKTSFKTLREMYEAVICFFENEFSDSSLVEVRAQKRSIGLIFELIGEQICIDVIPTRRTNFEKGGNEYNIYVNPSGLFGKPSRIKMNPHLQADYGTHNIAKAKVISLLKVLKEKKEYPLKSVFIKELTKEAFEKYNGKMPNRIDKQLIFTMEYIRDHIEYSRITSPDNSNNILSNSLTKNEKRSISDSLDYIIRDITENPSSLKKYFPDRTAYNNQFN